MALSTEAIEATQRGQGYSIAAVLTIAAGGSYTFVGTPDALHVHYSDMRIDSSVGPVGIEFIESPTVSDYGTKSTPLNRRRDAENPSRMGLFVGSTVSGGTVLFSTQVNGGSTGQGRGGEGIVSGEWVLDPTKIYAVKISNLTSPAVSASVSVDLQYYEDEM